MAKRRKKLVQKFLTYGECDRRTTRRYKKDKNAEVTLYGSITVRPLGYDAPCFEIRWSGNLRRAGGPSDNKSITLAHVYALSDGDTGYVVMGVGKTRNNTAEDHASRKIWRRYINVFTPHDPKQQLTENEKQAYRIHEGKVSPCGLQYPEMKHSRPEGYWWTQPSAYVPTIAGLVNQLGYTDKYPKFISRSRRFVSDLRKRLADGPTCVVQLVSHGSFVNFYRQGITLHVCLPPSRTQDGKQLVVFMCMHDKESRQFHHVDGDYAPRHSQYLALEPSVSRNSSHSMRWKCGKDALNGIVEWVLGSIHIPGPEM